MAISDFTFRTDGLVPQKGQRGGKCERGWKLSSRDKGKMKSSVILTLSDNTLCYEVIVTVTRLVTTGSDVSVTCKGLARKTRGICSNLFGSGFISTLQSMKKHHWDCSRDAESKKECNKMVN